MGKSAKFQLKSFSKSIRWLKQGLIFMGSQTVKQLLFRRRSREALLFWILRRITLILSLIRLCPGSWRTRCMRLGIKGECRKVESLNKTSSTLNQTIDYTTLWYTSRLRMSPTITTLNPTTVWTWFWNRTKCSHLITTWVLTKRTWWLLITLQPNKSSRKCSGQPWPNFCQRSRPSALSIPIREIFINRGEVHKFQIVEIIFTH